MILYKTFRYVSGPSVSKKGKFEPKSSQRCLASCYYATNGVMKISEANLYKGFGFESIQFQIPPLYPDRNRYFEPGLKERQRHGLFCFKNPVGNDPSRVYNHAVELRQHYITEHMKFGSSAPAFSDVSLSKTL